MSAPAGPAGRSRSGPPETARDSVRVGAFEIDRAPVTNARYARFVGETGHRAPAFWPNGRMPGHLADHPVVGVDLFDALAFARWAGGRLPTEAEWMAAAAGDKGAPYPWGADFDGARCNTVRSGVKGTTPVGRYPPAPSGCVDLCGNVWELTCTSWPDDAESVVVKGGSWYDFPVHARIDGRFRARAHKGGATVGFRLAYHGAMPPFLPAEVIDACIEFRRRGAAAEGADEPAAPEFEEVLSDLRRSAEESLDGLAAATTPPEADGFGAMPGDALEALEPVEVPIEAPSVTHPILRDRASKLRDAALRFAEVTRQYYARHPRMLAATMAAAGLLVTLLLFSAASEPPRPARDSREFAAASDARSGALPLADEVEARDARAGATSARRAPRARDGSPTRWVVPAAAPSYSVQKGIETLLRGRPEAREQAERMLLDRAMEARGALEEALRNDPSREAESSIRYLLAAIEDAQSPEAKGLTPQAAPPREGLLYFFKDLDGQTQEEANAVRLTAEAEGVPFTLVYTGPHEVDVVATAFSRQLRAGRVYADRDGELSRRLGIAVTPAVVGLKADGKTAFIGGLGISRVRLARETMALRP